MRGVGVRVLGRVFVPQCPLDILPLTHILPTTPPSPFQLCLVPCNIPQQSSPSRTISKENGQVIHKQVTCGTSQQETAEVNWDQQHTVRERTLWLVLAEASLSAVVMQTPLQPM